MLRRTLAGCGHRTRAKGEVTAFGVTIRTEMPRNDSNGFDYCLDCIAAMAIRCAWCAKPVFIGDPVTLYSPSAPWVFSEYAVIYSDEPLRVVGCLRWDCADTGASRAGFWLPTEDGRGRVHRVPSLFELALRGGGVLVSDLGDPTEVPTILSERK